MEVFRFQVAIFHYLRFLFAEFQKHEDTEMETWGHGDVKTCRHGVLGAWRWRHGNMETWRHVDMETWGHGDGDKETWRHWDMDTWRHGDIKRKQKPRQLCLICFPFAHHANGSLSFVCLLTKKQTELIQHNRLAHLCLCHTFYILFQLLKRQCHQKCVRVMPPGLYCRLVLNYGTVNGFIFFWAFVAVVWFFLLSLFTRSKNAMNSNTGRVLRMCALNIR
jgi:hypothetical protein